MSTTTPQLSVVMPVFNQEAYVAQAIQSVLDQTFKDFEFVIVDDGSTDRTKEIIRGFDDERIRLVCADHRGFISALKRGISEAKGDWIARMDSDDVCTPERLEKQIKFLAAHPECVFVTSYYGIVTPNNKYLAPSSNSGWHYVVPRDITVGSRPFCDPGTVFNRRLALEIGYDDQFTWEKTLWYGLLLRGKGAAMQEPLYFLRWRLGSVSRGQDKYPATLHYEMRKAYDPENAVPPVVMSSSRTDLKNMKKCVYLYAAAQDFSAIRSVIFNALRKYPTNLETFRLVRFWLALQLRPFKTYGPTGIRLFPVDRPIEIAAARTQH